MTGPPAETTVRRADDPAARVAVPFAQARRTALLSLVAVLLLLAAGVGGYAVAGGRPPGDHSPEAGFARDMQTHHAQAVEMAFIMRDKADDPTLRAITYDIVTTQQQQAGQMFAWLEQWGLSQTSADQPMAWMSRAGGAGHEDVHGAGTRTGTGNTGSMLLPDGRMPGMASEQELAQLEQATGKDGEVIFLRLMIAHHRGGVQMARAVTTLTDRGPVVALAEAIATSQQREITQVEQLLRERGAST